MKSDIQLEQIFLLAYYLGFTKSDIYNLPVAERMWYIQRTSDEIKKSSEKSDEYMTKAAHDNSPELRALRGLRPDTPARLRRFT